jgi:hypothetical protein
VHHVLAPYWIVFLVDFCFLAEDHAPGLGFGPGPAMRTTPFLLFFVFCTPFQNFIFSAYFQKHFCEI